MQIDTSTLELPDPTVIHLVRTPVGDVDLYVKWRRGDAVLDAVLDVKWARGPASGGIATYDGRNWQFRAAQSLGRGGDPARPLMNAVLLEGCSTEHQELQTRHKVKDHPFWKEFVRDVENMFPVADVMLA